MIAFQKNEPAQTPAPQRNIAREMADFMRAHFTTDSGVTDQDLLEEFSANT